MAMAGLRVLIGEDLLLVDRGLIGGGCSGKGVQWVVCGLVPAGFLL